MEIFTETLQNKFYLMESLSAVLLNLNRMGFENTVFLEKIGDHLLLVTLEPTGHHGDQDVEDHRRSSGKSQ